MRDQKIQRAFYEFIYEVRKDDPRDRPFLISLIVISLLAALLKSWIPESLIFTVGGVLVWVVAYRMMPPKMRRVTFFLRSIMWSALFAAAWLGFYLIANWL